MNKKHIIVVLHKPEGVSSMLKSQTSESISETSRIPGKRTGIPVGNARFSKPVQLLHDIYRYRVLFLMLLPSFLCFAIFRYGPIFGISIAFFDFRAKVGQTFFESIF